MGARQRKLRNYLLDAPLQLRFTAVLVLATLLGAGLLGIFLARALHRLSEHGLIKGERIGVDASTMEANAALRSIVRRDTGDTYQEFLTQLAQASGIATPTREDLARIDRKRPKKGLE